MNDQLPSKLFNWCEEEPTQITNTITFDLENVLQGLLALNANTPLGHVQLPNSFVLEKRIIHRITTIFGGNCRWKAMCDWMRRYDAQLRGSILLMAIHDTVWSASDIDFAVKPDVFADAISVLELDLAFGTCVAPTTTSNSTSNTNNDDKKIKSISTIRSWPPPVEQVHWNHIVNVTRGCFSWDPITLSFAPLMCLWHPDRGLELPDRDAVLTATGVVDLYSELVARVLTGAHPHHAILRLVMRIIKCTRRGITLVW